MGYLIGKFFENPCLMGKALRCGAERGKLLRLGREREVVEVLGREEEAKRLSPTWCSAAGLPFPLAACSDCTRKTMPVNYISH